MTQHRHEQIAEDECLTSLSCLSLVNTTVLSEDDLSTGVPAHSNQPRPNRPVGANSTETHDSIPLAGWLVGLLPRLQRLVQFPDNWDSRGTAPPGIELVWQILTILHMTENVTGPTPGVSPLSGGGIQLEWFMPARELEVEFHDDQTAAILAVDLQRDSEREGIFGMQDHVTMRELLGWVLSQD